ncbi:hypothetical protein DNU06_06065 [Putridiphycobacter roseus]|uniref:ABC3 transporter permease C-terminal domain-containing protein n=1 Tax=Putridiphycobacter roseus TaxID=2219161 RepID=A0A2W1N1M5_9FLAO|nr:FtsX-like permease family protein [Putridiphycobacter roseus]PZE18177.1 hypothetical protein DNU06_06065 [Putridiphycobacter roseus]
MSVIKHIFKQKEQKFQLTLSVIGLSIGLFVSFLTVVLYVDLQKNKEGNADVFGSNTVIIQKKVTSFTSLGLNNTNFTDAEITDLSNKSFITDIAPFESADYEVGISENPGDGLPGFYANMFLQSVPNRFIKGIDMEAWQWASEKDIVPIILPRDFLTLVNYGIAPSQGLPQISEDLIKSVRLRLHLIGANNKGVVLGQVVGFSAQVSSVLVPESFIRYSNKKYGTTGNANAPTTRLFLKLEKGAHQELQTLMEEMNLDISENSLSVSKIKTYLMKVLMVFMLFAFLILLLSVLVMLQFLQLIVANGKKDIGLLMKLGYYPQQISKNILAHNFKIIGWVGVLVGILVVLFLYLFIYPSFQSVGLLPSFLGLFVGVGMILIFLVGFYYLLKLNLSQTILKIFKKS